MNITPEEYNRRMQAFIKDLEENNRPWARAVQSTTQLIAKRIFTDGKDSSGAAIGKYDDKKPLYVDPENFPGASSKLKPPRGKNDDTKFKNGEPHKTTFVTSYKELRKLVGRQNAYVDLKLSGDLFSDFTNGDPRGKAQKVNAHEYVIQLDRTRNQKIMKGMNDKYGKISDATEGERNNCERVALLELINYLNKFGLA